MSASNVVPVLGDEMPINHHRAFPEWTQEDDSDVDIASLAQRQRVRFRAASIASRQRYQSQAPGDLSTLTHEDISRQAHEIRAALEGRKFGDFQKGIGAASSAVANGAGSAVSAVAKGFSNGAEAAASAVANGQGIGGAASAAAGSVADGIGKGIGAAAQAVAEAGGAFASAVAGSDSSDSDDDKKKKTKTKDDPPPTKTPDNPPPKATANDPPQVTEAPKPPPPPPPPPPPKETEAPSPPEQQEPDPPATSDKPIDNVPPPKAEQPSSNPSDSKPSDSTPSDSSPSKSPPSSDSPDKPSDTASPDNSPPSDSDSDATPTPTEKDGQKISLSTIVPGAIATSKGGARLRLTPVLSSDTSATTSSPDATESIGGPEYATTTPLAVGAGPTTLSTSVSPTGGTRTGGSANPSDSSKPNGKGGDGEDGSHGEGGLSPSGQSALISIGVLVGVCALIAVGFFFWRRRRQHQRGSSYGGSNFGGGVPSLPSQSRWDKPKRVLANLIDKIPYVRDKFHSKDRWANIDDPYGDIFSEKKIITATATGSPPSSMPVMTERQKPEPIRVQTTFTRRSSAASQNLLASAGQGGTVSSVGVSTMRASTHPVSAVEPSPITTSPAGATKGSPSSDGPMPSMANPLSMSPFEVSGETAVKKPATKSPTTARSLVGPSHEPKPSISSTTPQYNLTLPSALGGNRLSDLSSLSSGFGDGDIIAPGQQARKSVASSKNQARAANNTTTGSSSRNRASVATTATTSTTRSHGSARRDTVYTEASEDSPPRFRTVNSWVRQQTGRVKREKQREEDTANKTGTPPPVPAIPPEQEFRLMMPDGEEPRRVEDTDVNTGDWGSETKGMISGIGTAH